MLQWTDQDLVCVKVALEMAREHWRDNALCDDTRPDLREVTASLLEHAEGLLASMEPYIEKLRRRTPLP